MSTPSKDVKALRTARISGRPALAAEQARQESPGGSDVSGVGLAERATQQALLLAPSDQDIGNQDRRHADDDRRMRRGDRDGGPVEHVRGIERMANVAVRSAIDQLRRRLVRERGGQHLGRRRQARHRKQGCGQRQ